MAIVCYLDDSGGEDRPIVTLAGYLALAEDWVAFEDAVKPVCADARINVIHAVDMENSRGEFDEWDGERKGRFVSALFRELSRYAIVGISSSALRAHHSSKKLITGLSINQSAIGFCFNWILDRLLRDPVLPQKETLTFVIEEGARANAGISRSYFNIKAQYGLDRLQGIKFVPKESCVAIQVADMLAYYSRRHGEKRLAAEHAPVSHHPALSRMLSHVSVISNLATDFFGPEDD